MVESRRHLLLVAAGTLGIVSACRSGEKQKVLVQQEVERLAGTYPQDSIVRLVYLGDITPFIPVIKTKPEISLAPEDTFARIFWQDTYSKDKKFQYNLKRDGSSRVYPVLEQLRLSILFSSHWYDTTEAVKRLALEKEALTVAVFPGLAQVSYNTHLAQGEIQRTGQGITEREIADTLAVKLIKENPDIKKLFDYVGYLPLLPKVGNLLITGTEQDIKDLQKTNLIDIHQRAVKNNVPLAYKFNSPEFLELAFSPSSLWGKIVLDPSVPGPKI